MLVLSSVCLAQEANEIIPPTENIFAGLDMLASDVKPAAPVSSGAATVKTVEPVRAQTGAAASTAVATLTAQTSAAAALAVETLHV